MKFTQAEFDIYLAAFHAWKDATEEYFNLVNKIQAGDEHVKNQLQVLSERLDYLHRDFMEKSEPVFRMK